MSNTIQDTGSASSLFATSSSTSGTATVDPNSASAQQDKFLTMLVAQMKNQDPLNPMDNAAITTQMAQLSTVSGIDKLNSTLTALSSTMSLGSSTNMLGAGVLVPGSALGLSNSQAIGGVTLPGAVDSLSVAIQDASGKTVQTLQLGAQNAGGVVPFAWDGSTAAGATAPDGSYTFTAQAVLSGATTAPATLSYGKVNAITPGASGTTLAVGNLGNFDMSAVQQVL